MTNPDGLATACFELARIAKWTRNPIDADEIVALAERFAVIAKAKASEPLSIDLPLLERVVRYIAQAHGMPSGDNTCWFEYTLTALLEVARPNSGLDSRGEAFLHDMLGGIQNALADE
jgi:hypothetical protein